MRPHDDTASWFTSRRERGLWAAALSVTAAIALTLFFGPELARPAWYHALLAAAFALGMLLVGLAVVALAIGPRAKGMDVGLALAVMAVLVLLLVRLVPAPAERSHLIEYAVLAGLLYAALVERATNGRGVRYPAVAAVALATTIGVVDECLQLFMPRRVFDPIDILFNTLAAVGAVTIAATLRWLMARRADRSG